MGTISTRAIRAHYNRLSVFYCGLWGDHIHHGLWRNGESPREAQLELVTELAHRAGISPGAKVLDVGCGVGASATWLAAQLDCSVTGTTISPVQKWLAQKRAKCLGLDQKVQFRVSDANDLQFPAGEFDVIWVIESNEHLFDKQRFIRQCERILRPHGVLALCSWLKGASSFQSPELLAQICSGMLCPSLATFDQYCEWISDSGLEQICAEQIPARVAKTWAYCQHILEQPLVRICLPLLGRPTRSFAAQFSRMAHAYETGVLSYGMFAARKR